jgi:uncharacterized protein (TIGR02594 family)
MTREEACQKLHDAATAELGVHETPGPESTARIIEYDSHTTLKATSDEVAWCSAFANFIVDTSGFIGTHSAAAVSWEEWGVPLDVPILGCIVVMHRNDPNNPNSGHVTFCDSPDINNGIIRCVGGNQGDAVKVSRFPVSNVIAYRSPV